MGNKIAVFFKDFKTKKRAAVSLSGSCRGFLRGFYSEEMRSNGGLEGYVLVPIKGEKKVLASTKLLSGRAFNKYRLSTETMAWAASEIEGALASGETILLDEAGEMLCSEERFRAVFLKLLSSDCGAVIFSRLNSVMEKTLKACSDVAVLKGEADELPFLERKLCDFIMSRSGKGELK